MAGDFPLGEPFGQPVYGAQLEQTGNWPAF